MEFSHDYFSVLKKILDDKILFWQTVYIISREKGRNDFILIFDPIRVDIN